MRLPILAVCLALLFAALTPVSNAWADHCPEGMVHVEEPTDTTSGCAPAGDVERDEEGKAKVDDWCTHAPSEFGRGVQISFKAACNNHDQCYRSAAEKYGVDAFLVTPKAKKARDHCDKLFLAKLLKKCDDSVEEKQGVCKRRATLYYVAVRLAGWVFWNNAAK